MEQQQSDVKQRTRYKAPKHYKVIIHNDDETTFDFVIKVLQTVFHKSITEAEDIAMQTHRNGQAVVGIYTYDIANTKVIQVRIMAEDEHFPLRMTTQPE